MTYYGTFFSFAVINSLGAGEQQDSNASHNRLAEHHSAQADARAGEAAHGHR